MKEVPGPRQVTAQEEEDGGHEPVEAGRGLLQGAHGRRLDAALLLLEEDAALFEE